MLNLACGPCRDVLEAVNDLDDASAVAFHCVDAEPFAIAHGRNLLGDNHRGATMKWDVANVLRLRTSQKYDLVWASGLFDYLSDRVAVSLLRRMWKWTAPGGSLVFGQFHPSNPTRPAQEWCLDWNLIHRTADDCRRLCLEAGIPADAMSFDQERLGVVIFCHARRRASEHL